MIRKKKQFSRPKKLYEKSRIEEENSLVQKYGLKNKREIWKTLAKVNYYRSRAKALTKSSTEEQEVLYEKLRSYGLKIKTSTDVLALQVENILERRLPSILHKLNLAKTPNQARQLVVHKKVLVDGRVIDIPSYLVSVSEEKKIALVPSSYKAPKAEKVEENKNPEHTEVNE